MDLMGKKQNLDVGNIGNIVIVKNIIAFKALIVNSLLASQVQVGL